MLNRFILASALWMGMSPGYMLEMDADSASKYQQGILESGAQGVEQAVRDCEKHFEREITLPPQLPPVAFTHQFGHCYDAAGLDDHLEIHYVHQELPENDYKIELYPAENKLRLDYLTFHQAELADQTPVKFYKGPINSSQLLLLESGDWQYLLTSANHPSSEIGEQELMSIAHSLTHLVNSKNPQHAEWGALAVNQTKSQYNMDVVDYLFLGRTTRTRELAEERFKLWLKKGDREFGVYVTVSFNPVTDQFVSIRYEDS